MPGGKKSKAEERENWSQDDAKNGFVGAIHQLFPEAPAGDHEIYRAVGIGRYMIDRWDTEIKVRARLEAEKPGLSPEEIQAVVTEELNWCSDKHFGALTAESQLLLLAYCERHRQVVVASDLGGAARTFRKDLLRSALNASSKFRRKLTGVEQAVSGLGDKVVDLGSEVELLSEVVLKAHSPPKPPPEPTFYQRHKSLLTVIAWIVVTMLSGPVGIFGVIAFASSIDGFRTYMESEGRDGWNKIFHQDPKPTDEKPPVPGANLVTPVTP